MKHYTVNGRKDRYGNAIPDTNLRQMMEECLDFINERTLLQESMHQIGITVHRSPKCHAELAGEGVEYSWGFSKNAYRRLPMSEKRSKEKFRQSVRLVLSRTKLNKQRVRKFARRARGYICAYYHLAYGSDEHNIAVGEHISPAIIERIVKMFKTHRCALDFEGKFIKVEVDENEHEISLAPAGVDVATSNTPSPNDNVVGQTMPQLL